MRWTVVSDFDNTISLGDVTDTLLTAYAAPEWLEIEELWVKGLIGSHECMRRQIALLRATREQVDALADGIEIDPEFINFVKICAANDIPLTIASDGLDYVIKRILLRHHLEHLTIVAAHLKQTGPDSWRLVAPYAESDCSSGAVTCKCREAARQQALSDANKILYIGDGRSDYCVSGQRADLVLAKASLLTHCQQENITHIPCHNFGDATLILQCLIADQLNATNTYDLPETLYAKRA